MFLNSCGAIFGIHKPKKLNDEQIKKKARSIHVQSDVENLYKLDTSFSAYIKQFADIYDTAYNSCSVNNSIQKDLQQPLQVFYFSKDGNIQSYFTNCYAGGFPYLKWNRNDNFNNFPHTTLAPVHENIM